MKRAGILITLLCLASALGFLTRNPQWHRYERVKAISRSTPSPTPATKTDEELIQEALKNDCWKGKE